MSPRAFPSSSYLLPLCSPLVVQRLSDFRVPIRSSVTFTFERMVRLGPEPEQETEARDEFESKRADEMETQEMGDLSESPSQPRPPLHSRLSITFDTFQSEELEDRSDKAEEPDPVSPLPERREEPERVQLLSPMVAGLQDGDALSLRQEIERLRHDLCFTREQRDQLSDEVDELRTQLEITTGERNEFLRQASTSLLSPPLTVDGDSWERLSSSAKSSRGEREMPPL
jgi:hypothetical protein